ncbi:MAG: YceI family protein [Bifidobacteriaceae bacterium]|jgi:polyisoprenoid-binding protein YceI|nr:YceI family protein [Bifidobacteriaceae bacterium]
MTQLASITELDIPDLTAGLWVVDPRHSNAHFEVGHPRLAKIRGVIPVTEGTIRVGPDLAATSVNVVFNPAGVATGWGDRDVLLRGPNFFDVVSYPVWSFRSTGIERSGHQFQVQGRLTAHGVERAAEAVAQLDGVELLDNVVPQAAFTADSQIDRFDFGLTWTDEQAGSRTRTAREVAVGVQLVATLT